MLSQHASGACDASQLPADKLVQSITGVVSRIHLVIVKQYSIVESSRFATIVLT